MLVIGIILLINGLPQIPAHSAPRPSGLGVPQAQVPNVLQDGDFASGGSLAKDWQSENSTKNRPDFHRTGNGQEIVYSGTPGDTGLKRKVEVFQLLKAVAPGQRWQFSIEIRGTINKSYAIVGMEWFSVYTHTVGKVTGYGYTYIAEHDVYPPSSPAWQRVTAISPPLPANAKVLAVYLQLPEISPDTKIDVQIRSASLGLLPAGRE
jgi:hypothetical protein